MPELDLHGCRTQPLLSYLKALGVLRLVGLQSDPEARLSWAPAGHARLATRLDEDGLTAFFMNDYKPTPITSPWNGSSGYYPTDNATALVAVEATTSHRLGDLRRTIACARAMVAQRREPKAPKNEAKEDLLRGWRAQAPDVALDWLDAALVLTDRGVRMNPLLAAGGIDGHLEFSNNFLARLGECLPWEFRPDVPQAEVNHSRTLLLRALTDVGEVRLGTSKVGMFAPALAGMPNSWSISDVATGASLLNPWDFVLMLEGAVLFAGGVGRRLSAQEAIFPFTVAEGGVERVGRSMAEERTPGETWLPVWRQPASFAAVRRLLAEGRAQDGRSQARSGRAMGRATATLGVERGVEEFERIVYAKRFGDSNVAVPVDRVRVRASRAVELQRSTDAWVWQTRRLPGSAIASASRRLDIAAHATIADEMGAFERWLLALSHLELAVARLAAAGAETRVNPLQNLSGDIVSQLDDTPEVRLATALARALAGPEKTTAVPAIRVVLEPLRPDSRGRMGWHGKKGRGVPGLRAPLNTLIEMAQLTTGPGTTGFARLTDVVAFLEGQLDDERIVALTFALSLCRLADGRGAGRARTHPEGLDRVYAVAYLATRAVGAEPPNGQKLAAQRVPGIIPALAAGSVPRAVGLALTRLRADGLRPYPALRECRRPESARRIAAALAIPLLPADCAALEAAVLIPSATSGGNDS